MAADYAAMYENAGFATTFCSSTSLTGGYMLGTIYRVGKDVSNKYLTFMGGDHL